MNAIIEAPRPISPEVLEHVLGTGDLSKLSSQQRVEYMTKACELIGLNPLTRPFRFLSFQNQVTMYATRDCADQLRKLHRISVRIVDKSIESEIYSVTARASMPDGREDEDMGTVPFGKAIAGEFRANAMLKAITKAKRRVTLSICGLGFLDETEVESMRGAQTFDAEQDAPKTVHREPGPAPAKSQPAAPASGEGTQDSSMHPLDEPDGQKWFVNLKALLDVCQDAAEVRGWQKHDSVIHALANAPAQVQSDLRALFRYTFARLADPANA